MKSALPSLHSLRGYESRHESYSHSAVQMDMLTLHITRLPPRTFCKDASIFTPHQSSHYSKQIPHLSGLAKHGQTCATECVCTAYMCVLVPVLKRQIKAPR